MLVLLGVPSGLSATAPGFRLDVLQAPQMQANFAQCLEGFVRSFDDHGRRVTLNGMGSANLYGLGGRGVTPQIVDDFRQYVLQHATGDGYGDLQDRRAPYFLEIGSAYGALSVPLIAAGANGVLVDVSEGHLEVAKELLDAIEGGGRYDTMKTRFPFDALPVNFLRQNKKVVVIVSLNLLHLFHGTDILLFLDTCWDVLQPGGRVYLTTSSPWVLPLVSQWPLYHERKERFLQDPQNAILMSEFPGHIHRAQTFFPWLSTDFFHVTEPYLWHELVRVNPLKRFEVLQVQHYPFPVPGVHCTSCSTGELTGVVLVKPLTGP